MQEFNEAVFKTKVDNIFVKLFTAIMKGNLTEVDHFISDEVYNKYNNYIKDLDSKNQRQMYDELNVKDTIILNREIKEKEIVNVLIISRYMDYIIDKDTGELITGDDTRRIEKEYHLTFTKKLDAKETSIVKKCPTCGNSISVNNSGVCDYCHTIYNQEDYDYVLENIS